MLVTTKHIGIPVVTVAGVDDIVTDLEGIEDVTGEKVFIVTDIPVFRMAVVVVVNCVWIPMMVALFLMEVTMFRVVVLCLMLMVILVELVFIVVVMVVGLVTMMVDTLLRVMMVFAMGVVILGLDMKVGLLV